MVIPTCPSTEPHTCIMITRHSFTQLNLTYVSMNFDICLYTCVNINKLSWIIDSIAVLCVPVYIWRRRIQWSVVNIHLSTCSNSHARLHTIISIEGREGFHVHFNLHFEIINVSSKYLSNVVTWEFFLYMATFINLPPYSY